MSIAGRVHSEAEAAGQGGELRRSPDSDPEEISLLGLATVLLRHPLAIIGVAALAGSVIVAVGLHRPRAYTTTASFAPQSRQSTPPGVAGIAAQFGLTMPSSDRHSPRSSMLTC